MSSPARRLRTKTSDITDFFRGNGHGSHQSRQVQPGDPQIQVPAPLLEVPAAAQEKEISTSPKKRSTRIPFLGRTRKKSTQSVTAPTLPSTPESQSEIIDPVERTSTDQRSLVPLSSASSTEPSPSRPSLPTIPPAINVSSPSLGSKLAAHFTHSKSRKLTISTRTPPGDGSASDTLSPPSVNPRTYSFDSVSSGASRTRSPTPRPTRPTITVSPSPENLEEYGDLFTLPRNPITPKAATLGTTGTIPSVSAGTNSEDRPLLASPQIESPNTHKNDPRREGRRSVSEERKPISSSRKVPIPQINLGSASEHKVSRSPRTSNSTPIADPLWTTAQKRLTVATMPYQPSEKSFTSLRSRLRTPSSATERPNRPPSIPLPPPPNTNPPLSSLPTVPAAQPHRTVVSSPTSLRRPRAHTTGSVSNPPRAPPPSPSPPSLRESPKPAPVISEFKLAAEEKPGEENLDINTATPQQLRKALISRNQQYDELASYLLKITETHVAEKNALEKKISSLEREASRREKEIKGLTWLISNGGGAPGASTGGARSSSRIDSDQETHRSQSPAPSKLSLRRLQHTDDSGAESHPTSGAESLYGSGNSGTESASSFQVRKSRRPHTLSETSYSMYRSSSSLKRTTGIASTVPEVPSLSSPYKRSSVSSFSASPSSSTSSLIPLSPNSTATMPSLSAIPEAPLPLSKSLRESNTVSTTAEEREREEKRVSRSSHRISTTSQVPADSQSPAVAYAANLKRGRPPSIAQVLERSPNMEDVLDKLRPFGGSPMPTTT